MHLFNILSTENPIAIGFNSILTLTACLKLAQTSLSPIILASFQTPAACSGSPSHPNIWL